MSFVIGGDTIAILLSRTYDYDEIKRLSELLIQFLETTIGGRAAYNLNPG